MAILVTGASGFLGSALIPKLLKQGHKVYALSRHPPAPAENLSPLEGDILLPNLGIKEAPENIDAIYHLAAILRLGEDKDGSIWRTNVEGTKNVLTFCLKYEIPHLYFSSTAYTQGRNAYEISKRVCEDMLKGTSIPRLTIFKPSIVMGTDENFYPGHFSQFVMLIINTLAKARITWRKMEEILRLPILLEPVLRIRGNPEGKINLIQLEEVITGMSNIEERGTFWLTNPEPPTVQQLCDWVGDIIMVRMMVMPEFKPMPLEAIFAKKVQAFEPYMWGDNFPSDLKNVPPITREYIEQLLKTILLTIPLQRG